MDKRTIHRSAFLGAMLGWLFFAPPDLISKVIAATASFSVTFVCGRLLRRFLNPSNIVRNSQALATTAIVMLGCASSFALAMLMNAFS